MLVSLWSLEARTSEGSWWLQELLESSAAPPGSEVRDWSRKYWGPGPMACIHPALGDSCIGKVQGQQQKPRLTVGTHATLGMKLKVFMLKATEAISGGMHGSRSQLCTGAQLQAPGWWHIYAQHWGLQAAVGACVVAVLGPRAQAPTVVLAGVAPVTRRDEFMQVKLQNHHEQIIFYLELYYRLNSQKRR